MPTENKCSILASAAGGCSDHLGREIYKIVLEMTHRGYVCREGYEITYRMTYRVPKLERYWPQGTISAVIFMFNHRYTFGGAAIISCRKSLNLRGN